MSNSPTAGPYSELSGFPDCPNPRKAWAMIFRACTGGDREKNENLARLVEVGFIPYPGEERETAFDRYGVPFVRGEISEKEFLRLVLEYKRAETEQENAPAKELRQ